MPIQFTNIPIRQHLVQGEFLTSNVLGQNMKLECRLVANAGFLTAQA